MHVLIATDGRLEPDRVVPFVAGLAGGSPVTVLTVVEIPRTLLAELREVFGEQVDPPIDRDAEYVQAPSGGASAQRWPGDDAILSRYLDDQRDRRTAALGHALRTAGLDVVIEAREGENAAATILETIDDLQPDVVCVGSHGRGLFPDLIGGTGTKLMRHAPCPVLLVPLEARGSSTR